MTSSSGGRGHSRKRTVEHVVKMVFRRKVCILCFVLTILLFALLLTAAIIMTVYTMSNWAKISVNLRKQASLKSRSDVEAFYEILCPIYSNGMGPPNKWPSFDLSFCNRYCDRNKMFEFMYRQLNTNATFESSKGGKEVLNCPIYVEFKPCQTEDLSGHCEAKIFDDDFISFTTTATADHNETVAIGTCVPCSFDDD